MSSSARAVDERTVLVNEATSGVVGRQSDRGGGGDSRTAIDEASRHFQDTSRFGSDARVNGTPA
jgi:hypothetical protein